MTIPPQVAGIGELYHYERFIPERLASLLRDRRVRCSSPARLNDPWDCRPWFDTEFVNNPAALAEWVTWTLTLDRLDRKVRASLDEDLKALVSAIERNPGILRRIVANTARNVFQLFVTHWHIYCLTTRPCSTLMWSHYAENHRGICLEFTTNGAPFQCAQKVVYRSEYPAWQPHILLETRIEEALLTKSSDWQYEEEYRIIARRSNAGGRAGDKVLNSEDGHLTFPSGSLKSVIAGCEADYELITAIVKHYSPGVPIRRAVRHPNHYTLEIE